MVNISKGLLLLRPCHCRPRGQVQSWRFGPSPCWLVGHWWPRVCMLSGARSLRLELTASIWSLSEAVGWAPTWQSLGSRVSRGQGLQPWGRGATQGTCRHVRPS